MPPQPTTPTLICFTPIDISSLVSAAPAAVISNTIIIDARRSCNISFYISFHKIVNILHLYRKSRGIIARQVPISKLLATGIFDKLVKIKYDVPNNKLEMLDGYITEIDEKLDILSA